jgi:hypothetical protein
METHKPPKKTRGETPQAYPRATGRQATALALPSLIASQGKNPKCHEELDYKKNNMSPDREIGRGNKRAKVKRGSRNPKHGRRKHYNVHKRSRLN